MGWTKMPYGWQLHGGADPEPGPGVTTLCLILRLTQEDDADEPMRDRLKPRERLSIFGHRWFPSETSNAELIEWGKADIQTFGYDDGIEVDLRAESEAFDERFRQRWKIWWVLCLRPDDETAPLHALLSHFAASGMHFGDLYTSRWWWTVDMGMRAAMAAMYPRRRDAQAHCFAGVVTKVEDYD